eukprot:TRINITY_DN22479_c0_g1_i1.p3 TRINITY_DN22479_c0_g1~~TRINITY_DN22479_c0_g1_i1.p3  ORF type:complete len:125 (+),score=6.19 TRINITY_DN22479_c0_g1_i1:123-497(+)
MPRLAKARLGLPDLGVDRYHQIVNLLGLVPDHGLPKGEKAELPGQGVTGPDVKVPGPGLHGREAAPETIEFATVAVRLPVSRVLLLVALVTIHLRRNDPKLDELDQFPRSATSRELVVLTASRI